MEELFILALVSVTSLGGYLVGSRGFGRAPGDFRAAVGQMLACLGATLVFLGVNLAVGILVVLGTRALLPGFLSMYLSNDVSLVVLSAIQGLIFVSWRAGA